MKKASAWLRSEDSLSDKKIWKGFTFKRKEFFFVPPYSGSRQTSHRPSVGSNFVRTRTSHLSKAPVGPCRAAWKQRESPRWKDTFFKYWLLLFEPVDHGVVWLTIGIESNLIVPSSAGFLTHELTHALGTQIGQARKGVLSKLLTGLKLIFTWARKQTHTSILKIGTLRHFWYDSGLPEGVRKGHTGRLKAELVIAVAERVTLAINRAKAEVRMICRRSRCQVAQLYPRWTWNRVGLGRTLFKCWALYLGIAQIAIGEKKRAMPKCKAQHLKRVFP